jgi:hypothetical protein
MERYGRSVHASGRLPVHYSLDEPFLFDKIQRSLERVPTHIKGKRPVKYVPVARAA